MHYSTIIETIMSPDVKDYTAKSCSFAGAAVEFLIRSSAGRNKRVGDGISFEEQRISCISNSKDLLPISCVSCATAVSVGLKC